MVKSNEADAKAKRASKVDPLRLLVGVETDAEIARRAGVVPETVRIYRIRNGIPSARQAVAAKTEPSEGNPSEGRRPRGRPRKVAAEAAPVEASAKQRRAGVASPIDHYVHLLGTMPDTTLAEQIGVTRGAVYQYRRHRSIPAFVEQDGAPRKRGRPPGTGKLQKAAAEVTAAPVARKIESASGNYAYVIVAVRGGVEKSYSVVGADIVDACHRALRALGDGARVLSITQHLDAL